MKRLILFALLGGMALGSPAQSVGDNEVRIRGIQIELPATAHKLFPGDFDDYKGVYDLSNGDEMTLRQRGMHMYAQVGNGDAKEIVAAAHNVFVALDRDLKITLNKTANGDFRGEVLMLVPSRTASADAGQMIRLVSSR